MTDAYAIEGEEVGYVPCDDVASVLVAEEEGAISGLGSGYVPQEQTASSLPAPEREAIVGSAVGFVPKPCEECYQELVIDHFDRIRGAGTDLGTATIGTTWEMIDDGFTTGNYASVDGDKAVFPNSATSPETVAADWSLDLPIDALDAKPWIEFRWLCEADTVGGGGRYDITGAVPGTDPFIFWLLAKFGANSRFTFGRVGGFSLDVPKTGLAYVSGDPYWVALRFGAISGGSILYFKAWLAADPEPVDWDEDSSAHTVTLEVSEIDRTLIEPAISPVGSELRVDEILIRYPCD